METIKEKIRLFLHRHVAQAGLDDDQDIFAQGFVNSLFAMQLVLFVEKEFEISIEDDDLDIDNFRSVNAIAQLVARKKAHIQG
ncbi:acyl carrier protein [Thermosporothrix hazakensis]|jgi:acyl carrier protein|uniref:Acyl carrier protein n=2 Tax=Thermosporothrix TaxID=768650 RepID=A0A326UFU2_THEHA|nr:phosphopantetheine-binding protein [Thermosporothrix hazakensis]PZW26089.1 acyl carrier protein [Thermosporothrix hazakensis]BBH87062.1 hypothetical protein KTC_18130 [Thermosporothrix sp. COM3]GCE51348.1 hypothetical protein KTH_62170 [Thermosporothrix hazakensis]